MTKILDMHGDKHIPEPEPAEAAKPAVPLPGPQMQQDDGTTLCPHCGKDPFNLRMRPIETPMNGGRTHIAIFYCGDCRKAINAVFVDVQTLDLSGLYRGARA